MRPCDIPVMIGFTQQELVQVKIQLQVRRKRVERNIKRSVFMPRRGRKNADLELLKTIDAALEKVCEAEMRLTQR